MIGFNRKASEIVSEAFVFALQITMKVIGRNAVRGLKNALCVKMVTIYHKQSPSQLTRTSNVLALVVHFHIYIPNGLECKELAFPHPNIRRCHSPYIFSNSFSAFIVKSWSNISQSSTINLPLVV